ncbi:hypothetical protein DP113_15375 [Brasilonema octagenarum UFV-E1]|uniref:Uncharacterized protein n=2 Tax=Brasilonema TaxID=383614 RepID=A0A856MJG3_9CYAN|nr:MULTISPECIES: hypothetical protein [Brasilonema]NMF61261.1 hypothetical protein [Brasilonema octagenarum UFV-OR1]QDL09106.1 hypothetical protein DP114_15435 [Brasilonema sennae CENA114]QDL15464.1 hypothetical protein DP113_15375 [Brasilonema octagenarum UFV-E1]
MPAHNSRLITPCAQLWSLGLRAYLPWADKESPLSLRGRVFTFIPSEVQPFDRSQGWLAYTWTDCQGLANNESH